MSVSGGSFIRGKSVKEELRVNILILLVTLNTFSTIFALQNKFVGLLLFVIYWSIF